MANTLKKKTFLPFNQNGFTLIEAMVAFAIFVIGILGAYKLQLHSTEGNTLANRISTSTLWASYAIEEVLSKDYDDLDLLDNGDSNTTAESDTNVQGHAGLEIRDSTADGVIYIHKDGSTSNSADGALYSIYYNIADGDGPYDGTGDVLKDIKKIRVHVVRNGGIGDGLLYSHNYYKARWPE